MHVIRWFQAFAGGHMTAGKKATSLEWEMAPFSGVRAAEWIPSIESQWKGEQDFLSLSSNMTKGIGFLYRTDAIRRRFKGDVWSRRSKYDPSAQGLYATRVRNGRAWVAGDDDQSPGTHNECWVTGAPKGVVVSRKLPAGERRRILSLARRYGLEVYTWTGSEFSFARLSRIA